MWIPQIGSLIPNRGAPKKRVADTKYKNDEKRKKKKRKRKKDEIIRMIDLIDRNLRLKRTCEFDKFIVFAKAKLL